MRGKAVDFLNMDSPKKISGSVRVVSKRKGGAGAAADETVIDVDYYGGMGPMAKHGLEMIGAARLANDWADEIEKEAADA